jgi:hypothetical protein
VESSSSEFVFFSAVNSFYFDVAPAKTLILYEIELPPSANILAVYLLLKDHWWRIDDCWRYVSNDFRWRLYDSWRYIGSSLFIILPNPVEINLRFPLFFIECKGRQ